jgi:hypothetical protein
MILYTGLAGTSKKVSLYNHVTALPRNKVASPKTTERVDMKLYVLST